MQDILPRRAVALGYIRLHKIGNTIVSQTTRG
jgi:hypothetical protein